MTALPRPADLTLEHLLTVPTTHSPEATAIIGLDRPPLTYRRLRRHIQDIGTTLGSYGISRNDRVALVLPNGPDMATAFLAVSTWATSAPLNPMYQPEEFRFYLTDLQAKAVILPAATDSPVRAVAHSLGIPLLELTPHNEAAGLFSLTGDGKFPAVTASPAQSTDVALLLHTAGTTSRPKLVPLTQTNIGIAALNTATALALEPQDRSLNVMPLFHIHGLVGGLLSSLIVGASVVCTPGFDQNEFFTWLQAFHPTWYTAVPTMHQAVLAQGRASHGMQTPHSLRFIRSASSSLPVQVLTELEEMFTAPVIESYGMTEAAPQITCNPLPPAIRKVGSVGKAAGPEVTIMDEAGMFLPAGATGEVVIRGTNVTSGYVNNPEANASAFTHGWFRTGDQGYLDQDGYLFITGRIKEIINRAGEKVAPREVDEVLLTHPAVAQAVTFAVPHPTLGEDVAAAVVLRQGQSVTAAIIRQSLFGRVADFKIPSQVVIVDEIPKSSTGKIQRRSLATQLASQLKGNYVAPRNDVERKIAKIYSATLGVEHVGIYDNFFALGGDSLRATRVLAHIRALFQKDFPIHLLFRKSTVAELTQEIVEALEKDEQHNQTQPLPALALAGEHTNAHAIPRRSVQEHLPLSFAQQRLWLFDQFEPNSALYNVSSDVRWKGAFHLEAFRQAFVALMERHESLRTTFPSVDGTPLQVIAEQPSLDVTVVDVYDWPESERESAAQRLITEEAYRPFNLAQGPLVRVLVVQVAPEDYRLIITMHHIISDGWSRSLLIHELATLYSAFSAGQALTLPPLPIQYADFAIWQRQQLQGDLLADHLRYWQKQLEGAPPLLPLPTDHPRPTQQTYGGTCYSFPLPSSLIHSLQEISQREGATLYMTLLAAFQILLSRYTGQEDIVVGSPIAGRTHAELEGLVGFFVNLLVLRTDVSNNPTFRELLRRVQETALGAYAHQDVPYEKLVDELRPQRDLSYAPLVQVLFALQNFPTPPASFADAQSTSVSLNNTGARFDLSLFLWNDEHGLRGEVEYNTDLFDETTIIRLVGHYQTLLTAIADNPDKPIATLPLLTPQETHQLLIEWNETQVPYPDDQCVHQLFEAQVERTPEAVAVVYEDQQLTYRELNARANQLAHYLQHLGVGPETLVGVCLERSLEMVISLFAILKAGGAYVPLDPSYPSERLQFMLAEIKTPVILTQQALLTRLSLKKEHCLCLDSDWSTIAQEPVSNPLSTTTPDNLVYMIYTSGSTGTPKGALNIHRGLCNRLQWMQDAYQLTVSDRVLQKTPYSFDVSVWEFFWPLLQGARLVVARPDGHRDSTYLVELINAQQITTLHFVPSMLAVFLEDPKVTSCTSIRQVICSGEALPVEVQQRFFTKSNAKLHNLYGPTEASIDVTSWACQPDSTRTTVPIGRPIANTQIYILDQLLQPVPIGVAGELYLGGVGVGRGYYQQPELTAKKFIADLFSQNTHARLYKTGDLARYLADGNIEYLGRLDHQVKLRGFRIELGEIEAVLSQHPTIQQSVIVLREDIPGDKQIVAYVVPHEVPLGSPELREYLKAKLPEYMVPSAFVLLETLPLSANGKIDRKALPKPDRTSLERDVPFTAPRSPVEEILADIWAEMLKLDKVGVYDNFFELGGHSLWAVQLVSRIRDTFHLEIPLRSVFAAPTIAGLAEQISVARGREEKTTSLPIVSTPCNEEWPLSFAQERFWFLEQFAPNNPAYKTIYGFHLTGLLNIEALEQALVEIVRRHESLRTTFHEQHERHIQRVAEQWSFRLRVVSVPGADLRTEVERLFADEQRQPFNLATDLLLRGTLLCFNEREHVLMMTSHHIAWDHWSIKIFFQELTVLYRAFTAAQPSPLPAPPIQYRHYASWQRNLFQGTELDNYLAYWKGQLSGAPASLNLPIDHPRQPLLQRRGRRQVVVLPQEVRQALETLSKQANVTLFMVYLTAFQTLLHRLTGEDDIVVGTPVAGRDRSETENLIGLFLNTLPLRTKVSGNMTFHELLAQVREVTLGAYDHRELPFERLVAEIQPDRNIHSTPIFQVFINMYNFKEVDLELAGLSVRPLEGLGEAALGLGETPPQFDLELIIREHDDGTHVIFNCDSDLFEETTIRRLLSHYQTLLAGIIANPQQSVATIPLLTRDEKHQLLVEWNNTTRDYPTDVRLHQLIEKQVERTPDAVAVVFEKQRLTYRELNDKANQLAHRLRALGVKSEVLVGVCLERSVELMVGLLGILKAGAAYVPLDPDLPQDRLAFMLQDSHVPVLLTHSLLLSKLPESQAQSVCLDRDWKDIAQESTATPVTEVTADNLAYLIYTSGSTGTPKGALNTHRGICNRLLWMQETYQLSESDRVLQKTPYSFDVSVWEFFWPLMTGACVVFARPQGHRDPGYLVQLITEQQITVLHFVPSMLAIFLEEANVEQCHSLRQVVCSGEALSYELQQRFFRRLTTRLDNLYGPTEAAVDVTYWPCERDDPRGIVPIGRPVANTQMYILDAHLQPVPVGTPGELYIGGVQVGRGYLNRPELTAERFIPDPFRTEPGARLYKTGDLARYRPDGIIEYLGRNDDQVKLRGYRIELGEIEAALHEHAGVHEVTVIAREYAPGDRRLVAYVVPSQDCTFAIHNFAPSDEVNHHEGRWASPSQLMDDIRAELHKRLPDYMVPATFMFLEKMPLSPNGKVDRKVLATMAPSSAPLGQSYTAPRTELERYLAQLWCDILKLEQVGIHDKFFEVGGNSLLGVTFINKVRQQLGEAILIVALFEAPTIAQFALLLSANFANAVTRVFGVDAVVTGKSGKAIQGIVDKKHRDNTTQPNDSVAEDNGASAEMTRSNRHTLLQRRRELRKRLLTPSAER